MVLLIRVLQRRHLCTATMNRKAAGSSPDSRHHLRPIKQVTNSNFPEALEEIGGHIRDSHFIAVSLRKTGSHSSPWQRVFPFDSAEIAYLKSKYAAERFQVLQFAVCPFSVQSSKLIAHPYNFHLFPRDELRIGMPSYSFSCQSTYLEFMAKEGFDFNACIYDGISYLSRAQESSVEVRLGNLDPGTYAAESSSAGSVADSLFVERIKSRVRHWLSACKDSGKTSDEAFVRSLKKIILGSEEYASRPCLSIDVCSEHQVLLALEMLKEFSDDVVPLRIPAKGGGTLAVRAVLMSSKEDKDLFEKELLDLQDKQRKKVRGFREVIDLISDSRKPVISQNSLNDFTLIHSKFLARLPPTLDEFGSSLQLVFPQILDIHHLMKEIGPLKKVTNLPAAISRLKTHFFAPIDVDISYQAGSNEDKFHGHNALRISELFAKLCWILKITPETFKAGNHLWSLDHEDYTNILDPSLKSGDYPVEEDVPFLSDSFKKISNKNFVFLWGFRVGMPAGKLKTLLCGSHEVFSKEFNIQPVGKSCAAVVFPNPDSSGCFLEAMDSGAVCCEPLRQLISQGLRGASYQTYEKVCRLGLWERELADALEIAAAESNSFVGAQTEREPSDVCWNDLIINLDDL